MKNLKKLRTEKKPLNADDIYVTFKDVSIYAIYMESIAVYTECSKLYNEY